MAFWTNRQKLHLPDWDRAKCITKEEAQRKDLEIGWYFYKDGYVWYGLRPNAAGNGMERSFHQADPQSLQKWLGKSIPESEETKKENILVSTKLPISQEPLDKPAELPPEKQEKPSRRKRENGVLVRFSDKELVQLQKRVQQSGRNQSSFIREAALTGRVMVEEPNLQMQELIDGVDGIRAQLGRLGGLLKMVIKPNEGQRELNPQQWQELIDAVRYLEHTKAHLANLEAKLSGHHQTPNQ